MNYQLYIFSQKLISPTDPSQFMLTYTVLYDRNMAIDLKKGTSHILGFQVSTLIPGGTIIVFAYGQYRLAWID